MKIGITCYATYGGSGILATELGKALAQKGHEVHFITSSQPIRLSDEYQKNLFFHKVEAWDYPLFGDSKPYALALAVKMAEIFKQEKLDLLHVHYAVPHAISAYLAQQMMAPANVPIVTTLHGTDVTLVGKDDSYRDITRFSLNKSTVVTAVSDYLRELTEVEFKPEIEISRVHNFVDTDRFKPISNKDSVKESFFSCCGINRETTIYLHLSNFRPVKRTEDVIRTFYKIQKEITNSFLVMAGDGPELNACRELAEELGVMTKVRFLGNQADIVSLVQIADVVLFPSLLESFGLVPLEAMSCEVPVIASRSGGVPEVVEDGFCGYLADVGDIDEMAEKAILLGKDKILRQKLGKNGRERSIKLFSKEAIVSEYEKKYELALCRHM